MSTYDVVIVGGGPAGCSTALHLLQLGIQPLLLEQDNFPRFHIGESLTGEANAVLDRLGLADEVRNAGFVTKYGVNVWGPEGKSNFFVPTVPGATIQVDRARFDQILLKTVRDRGGEVRKAKAKSVLQEGKRVIGLAVIDDAGNEYELRSRVVVDASGAAAFLSKERVAGSRQHGAYNKQVAIFSRVKNADLGDGKDPANWPGNTQIFYRGRHHWAWLIPITEEVVSIGVVVPSAYFTGSDETREQFLMRELMELNPVLKQQIPDRELLEEVRTASNYSYRVSDFTGPGHLAVGDAHRFVDPIFSFGVHIGLTEGKLAAEAIARYLATSGEQSASDDNPFAEYEKLVESGQDVFEDLIHFFWKFPLHFLRYINRKHRNDLIEIFAGRVYGEPSPGLLAFRELLANSSLNYQTPGESRLA